MKKYQIYFIGSRVLEYLFGISQECFLSAELGGSHILISSMVLLFIFSLVHETIGET